MPRTDDARWHRHVRKAAVELRKARKTATKAALPDGLLADTFQAELTILDARDAGSKATTTLE